MEAHAQASGQRVVGYYHANALAKDTELPTQARRVADALAAAHPGCIVLLVRAQLGHTHPTGIDFSLRLRLTLCTVPPQADAQALADRETALPPVAWQVSCNARVGGCEGGPESQLTRPLHGAALRA